LPHQEDALLVIDRHHHGAAEVADHASLDLEAALGIDRDVLGNAEQAAIVDLLAGFDFHDLA